MTFGAAVAAMRTGFAVERAHWAGGCVWILPEAMVPVERISDAHLAKAAVGGVVHCKAAMRFMAADKSVITGWTPSMEDIFATDWSIVKRDDSSTNQ